MPAERTGPPVLYSVVATVPDEQTLGEYVTWLRSGHLRAVLDAGAISAWAVRVQDPPAPLRIEASYVFPSLGAFKSYQEVHGPRLRAEGMVLFGPRGLTFERRLGTIEAREPS